MDAQIEDLMSLTWTFQGSTYELHKTPKSLNAAAQAAAIDGRYLAEINSEEENNAIFQQVSSLISTEEFASTTSRDGGGAAYVWIGGSDQDSEGNWQWINSRQTISLSRSEWGSGKRGSEPDGGTFQNGLGLGLENWPRGSSSGTGFGDAGSWNDINTSSALFYVTEQVISLEEAIIEDIQIDPGPPEEATNETSPKIFTITPPKKFKKKSSMKIKNFNTEIDLIQIDTASFGIDDILDPATAQQAEGKKAVKKLAKQDFDFLYDEKKGGLYFNENGSDKGFGEGGIIAILKGGPDLTSSNLEFI